MKIVEINRTGDLDNVRDAWDALCRAPLHGELFQTREWLDPWLRAFRPDGRIAFLFAFEDGQPTGFVPLIRDPGGTGCPGPLRTPVNPHVRRQGVLATEAPGPLLDAVMDHLEASGRASCVAFRHLPVQGALAQELRASARRAGTAWSAREEMPSAVADLSEGWDAYVATRSRQVTREMRRKARRMEEAGGWHLRCYAGPDEWEDAYAAVVSVEAESWKQAAGTSIASEPGAAGFYGEVLRMNAARGRMRVHVLEHEGHAAAHVLGLVDGTTFLALKTAYDQRFRAFAPGAVLMWHAMEDAAARGIALFDFLGDTASWKQTLATEECAYESLVIYPRGGMRCRLCRTVQVSLRPRARRLRIARAAWRLRGRIAGGLP